MKRVFGNFLAAVSKEMEKDVAKFDWTKVDDKFDWRKMREIGGEGLATFDWKKMGGVGAQEVAKVLKLPEEGQETSVEKGEDGRCSRVSHEMLKHEFWTEDWRYMYMRLNKKPVEKFKDYWYLLQNKREREGVKGFKQHDGIFEKFKPTEEMLLKGRKEKKNPTPS